MSRFEEVIQEIDRINQADPETEYLDGIGFPKELIYSVRLSRWVLALNPKASEALKIAARGQHIARWTIPRMDFPANRAGYLQWREKLKKFHAEKVSDILAAQGYEPAFITDVKNLILKKDIQGNADTQTLEDGLCLLFLQTQFADLKSRTPADKMAEILRKTWRKMSDKARSLALSLDLEPDVMQFIKDALGR